MDDDEQQLAYQRAFDDTFYSIVADNFPIDLNDDDDDDNDPEYYIIEFYFPAAGYVNFHHPSNNCGHNPTNHRYRNLCGDYEYIDDDDSNDDY